MPKNDGQHLARRFSVPVIGVAAIIIVLTVAFLLAGIGKEDTKDAADTTDIQLYDSLGLTLQDGKVTGGTQVYSRDEIVEIARAEAFINERKNNPMLSELTASDAVTGMQKKATVYAIVKSGIEEKTLVEIRFQINRDAEKLRIIEAIPKTTAASSDEITLTNGGVIAEKDPVIMFTFNNAKKDDVLKAEYVINKKLSTLNTLTIPAEETKEETGTEATVCGDGRCVEGENYLACCTDCGCPSGTACRNNNCEAVRTDACQTDTDCNDNNADTTDTCEGTPKICHHAAATLCIEGDNQCPAGCIAETDSDCPPTLIPPAIEGQPPQTPIPNINGEQESPDITDVTITPEEAAVGDVILFEAEVTDANGKEDIATVWLEVMELVQTHDETGEMNDLGVDGDRTANDNIYTIEGVISDYYTPGTYHANIFAQDSAGNKKKSQKTFRVI